MGVLVTIVVVLIGPVLGLVFFNGLLAWRVERRLPPAGRFTTVDGTRLHYVDRGEGPPILLLHGLASQLQSFTYALADRLEGRYRLIMPDRPGSGYSRPGREASLAEQGRLMSGLLQQLGVSRALVVGHSLGGALALSLAIARPDEVAGLVLIAPATQPMDEAPEALEGLAVRSDPIRWIYGWTIASLLAMRHRAAILGMLFHPRPAPADFGTRGASLLTLRPWTYRNACRDLAGVAVDLPVYARRYGEVGCPVGVLYGKGDRILDHDLHGGRLREQLRDVELCLVDDGGHMLPLSDPEPCVAMIDRIATRAGLVRGEAKTAST